MTGNFLKKLLESGYKQVEIARLANIKPSHLNKLLKGEAWSLDTAIKIADSFHVSIDEVLGRNTARTLTPEEEKILLTTDGDRELASRVLRSAQGEKLITEKLREQQGRGRGNKAA